MYLYVSSLALDILTLSAPSFVTQDRSIVKEQRMEIKEVKGVSDAKIHTLKINSLPDCDSLHY